MGPMRRGAIHRLLRHFSSTAGAAPVRGAAGAQRAAIAGCVAIAGCAVLGGCAAGAGEIGRWEEEGDLPALKRALTAKDPQLRKGAAAAIARYAAYDTSRPAMLATLDRAGTKEARDAAQGLFGQPPTAAPDPLAPAGAVPAGSAVLYFYRPAAAGKDEGAAEAFAVDGAEVVRLRPGRVYRYETGTGSHRLLCHLPPAEGEPQKDMSFVVSTPVAGTYFVRHTVARGTGKAAFDVMPVPPGLKAVQASRPAEEGDVAPEELRRMKERRAP